MLISRDSEVSVFFTSFIGAPIFFNDSISFLLRKTLFLVHENNCSMFSKKKTHVEDKNYFQFRKKCYSLGEKTIPSLGKSVIVLIREKKFHVHKTVLSSGEMASSFGRKKITLIKYKNTLFSYLPCTNKYYFLFLFEPMSQERINVKS